jgi:hypothetical protein
MTDTSSSNSTSKQSTTNHYVSEIAQTSEYKDLLRPIVGERI